MPDHRLLPIAVIVVLAGCAAGANSSSAARTFDAQGGAEATQLTVGADAGNEHAQPTACDVEVHVQVSKHGGAFRVPPCDGWKGLIRYPATAPTQHWRITSSTTNTFGVPAPPSGTAIFYLRAYTVHPRNIVRFANSDVLDTITSPGLTSSHSYTLIVYRFLCDSQCNCGSCPPWEMSLGSPQPGSHSITFVSPLNGALVGYGSEAGPVWQFIQNS
jgi:hypothetical protein